MTWTTRVTLIVLGGFIALSNAGSGAGSSSDEQLLATAKSTRVSQIEPGMPDLQLESWLRSLVGSEVRLEWALNDCGEQSGDPAIDDARDLPICAELKAPLDRERSVYLYFLVGTRSKGPVESRGLYFVGVLGGTNEERSFSTLSALGAYLRSKRD